ncbi:MAG: S8 family peptidase [Acidimicrobiaceae bacterium]|nr:S8 family peptidase [Acidimicrobiaceae bacterium]
MSHAQRPKTLGIDPRLIVVFELGERVSADEFRKSGLRVVDSSDSKLMVAFADDPELDEFRRRLDALVGGIPEGSKSEPYAQFFDAIDNVRPLQASDRVTPELAAAISEATEGDLRIDVECWHPGEADRARDWATEVNQGIRATEGRVVDTLINDRAGLLLMRAYVPSQRIMEVAELDAIARMDVLPQPALPTPTLHSLPAAELPEVRSPDNRSPIVGLVDSGVASGHPLIGPAILASDAVGTNISDDQDEHGHGTMVASLLLYGNLQAAVAASLPLQPICRVVSARVLDADSQFPVDDLWERDLHEAITWCANQGARIINLSIGDDRSPFSPPRQMSAAAIVDDLARQLGLVIVVSTGNSRPADYLPEVSETSAREYPTFLLRDEATGILDPGTSLLSLTVGGLTDAAASGAYSSQETLRRQPMGEPGWPSPVTRRGPGPDQATKPEVSESAGTHGIESGRLVTNDPELCVIGANALAGNLLKWDVGTSFAAPLVSRVAAAIASRFPDFSAELVRSLVLLSTERVPFTDHLEGGDAARLDAERALLGFGRPSIARAAESTSHRAILVAEGNIPINGVHIYEIPIPSSFNASGGKRGLDIALSYSPRTRVRRLDYKANRIGFCVVKGLPLNEVSKTFANIDEEEFAPLSQLRSRHVRLEPSATTRSRGANQLGRKVFHQRLDPTRDSPMFLVVRNVNRWDDEETEQSYALSLALWRDEDRPELHAELRAQLEAVVEIPVEIEIEAALSG